MCIEYFQEFDIRGDHRDQIALVFPLQFCRAELAQRSEHSVADQCQQFESDIMYDMVKEGDSTRLVDSTSGWFWQDKSDFDSEHIYFKVVKLPVGKRPLFVSECGGYSMAVEGHYYSKYASYGYGACSSKEELTEQIVHMYEEMIISAIEQGACGCV